ncbi:MAG: multicopper oxidase family protein, partial [Thermodesulfobacteriota bacterium]
TGVLAWLYAVDQTLMWADPLNNELNQCKVTGGIPGPGTPCAQNYEGPIPAVPHLHGGEIPPELDGGPDAWFTSDGLSQGHGYYSAAGAPGNGALYKYPNTQEAGPIWFHDHLLGGTRLNVYMGLAGAYYIQDLDQIPIADGGNCDPAATPPQDCLPVGLQALGDVVPLVIQDRMFDNNGQLFFPSDSGGGVLWTSNPEHPYWVPEFVGDTIAVNGKVWPYLNVEPKRYRFVFINGSNARTYQLSLPNPVTGTNVPIQIIATDGGYLDAPVPVNKLVIMPGERYEAIIDFAGMAGSTLVMKNNARTPYPKGATPQGSTLGRIVQFRVVLPLAAPDTSYNPAAVPTVPLRPASLAIHRLPGAPGGPAIVTAVGATQNVQVTRQLTLNEVLLPPNTVTDPVTGALTAYPGGPLEALLNNSTYDGKSPRTFVDYTPITIPGFVNSETWYFETPQEGDTEVWELVNLTGDAHPIHLHLVQFQVIDRRNFDLGKYNAFYNTLFPAVPGDAVCTGGVYCPGFGPPLNYLTGNPRALGGNPDVTPYLKGKATPALPEEQGWKDTVVAYPGQVTRLAVRWAPTSLPVTTAAADLYFPFDPLGTTHHGYVWHCHIVDHEDNEMMRPNMVPLNSAAPAPASRPLVRGVAY